MICPDSGFVARVDVVEVDDAINRSHHRRGVHHLIQGCRGLGGGVVAVPGVLGGDVVRADRQCCCRRTLQRLRSSRASALFSCHRTARLSRSVLAVDGPVTSTVKVTEEPAVEGFERGRDTYRRRRLISLKDGLKVGVAFYEVERTFVQA